MTVVCLRVAIRRGRGRRRRGRFSLRFVLIRFVGREFRARIVGNGDCCRLLLLLLLLGQHRLRLSDGDGRLVARCLLLDQRVVFEAGGRLGDLKKPTIRGRLLRCGSVPFGRMYGTNLVRPILSCCCFFIRLLLAIFSDEAWFRVGSLFSCGVDVDAREGLLQRLRDLRTAPL